MVYNRCVGTRYCSNNCPYKVRRFNFFLYADWTQRDAQDGAQPGRHGAQPRRDGEVHLLRAAHRATRASQAKREDRPIRDGEIVTACQQACPTEAIVFGDLNDPTSRVAQLEGRAAQLRAARRARTRGRARRTWRGCATRTRSSESGAADGEHRRDADAHARARRRSSGRATPSARSPTRSAPSSSTGRTPRGWFVGFGDRASRCCMLLLIAITYLFVARHRHLGHQHPGRLGLRHHQLRLVDRHRPRRHADLGHPAAAAPEVAHVDQPLRRGDDAVRGRLRRALPAPAHSAGRGSSTGCSRTRTRWACGRTSAARSSGTCSRSRPTPPSRCCSGTSA